MEARQTSKPLTSGGSQHNKACSDAFAAIRTLPLSSYITTWTGEAVTGAVGDGFEAASECASFHSVEVVPILEPYVGVRLVGFQHNIDTASKFSCGSSPRITTSEFHAEKREEVARRWPRGGSSVDRRRLVNVAWLVCHSSLSDKAWTY
mmetsp:Transcript_30976/g.45944  ORF Transcript_30976/g.45944 Transcript_30976/m.45944 type:complete len:149 (-) Transcript_30976:59-505(-)